MIVVASRFAVAVALSARERQSINHLTLAFKIRTIIFPPKLNDILCVFAAHTAYMCQVRKGEDYFTIAVLSHAPRSNTQISSSTIHTIQMSPSTENEGFNAFQLSTPLAIFSSNQSDILVKMKCNIFNRFGFNHEKHQ